MGASVLALDLGSSLGWALHRPDGRISSGARTFDKRGGEGHRWWRFRCWLTDMKNTAQGIDALYYERVDYLQGINSTRVLFGFEATVTGWCAAHGIPCRGIPVSTIKKHATGRGDAKKADIVAAMQRLGRNPATDNEADALALLHLGLERIGEAA